MVNSEKARLPFVSRMILVREFGPICRRNTPNLCRPPSAPADRGEAIACKQRLGAKTKSYECGVNQTSSGRLWMVGGLKVWLYTASKAWLEMQCGKDSKALKGAGTYRLTVLANAPIQQKWLLTVYD